ncbi:polyprotein [Abeliophyllum distichum]|uniref:Polyprotein n=1 Tax=Abeliophyllum distichum TaxID=126358 RepID=A0ABD1SER9_9LAMI
MLKKNAPAWSEEQTKAIKEIKQKVHGLPALSIPTDGKRILQTDASDLYWAAVLLEEKNGYHFFIEMDMSAFPKMMNFKQKQIPNFKLLRWAEWFSNFDFEVKHIKGHNNLLPDLLSRPKSKPVINKIISVICMIGSSSSKSSSSRPPEIYPNIQNFPPEIHDLIKNKTLKARSKELMLKY